MYKQDWWDTLLKPSDPDTVPQLFIYPIHPLSPFSLSISSYTPLYFSVSNSLALLSVCLCFPILSCCLPFYLSATGNGFFPDPGGWNGILSQTKRSLCESSKIQRMKGRLIIIRKLLASTSFHTHPITYSQRALLTLHKMFLVLSLLLFYTVWNNYYE